MVDYWFNASSETNSDDLSPFMVFFCCGYIYVETFELQESG
ncbi:hypothetical protein OROGR_032814 [Orobanche gracilis]